MSDNAQQIFHGVLMLVVVAAEWYVMQPYREPVIARMWDAVARLCRFLAYRIGRYALKAEHNYYIAAEAGI